jgi:hypothetical protein
MARYSQINKGDYMKKLDVRFDTEKVNAKLFSIGHEMECSKSEAARAAMNIGLDILDNLPVMARSRQIEDNK